MSKDRIRRYSESAPREMQAKLRRIVARNGDFFKTRELDVAVEGGNAAVRRWAEARKSAETGQWTVKQFQKQAEYLKRTQDGELKTGGVLTQAAVLKDACFFDALYACAQLESADMRDADPAQAAKAREAAGSKHYQALAEAEGIVFDARDNMPVPVVNGEIVSDDCVLNDNALEVARRAEGNLAPENALVSVLPKEDILSGVVNLPALETSADELINSFARAAKAKKIAGKREANLDGLKHSLMLAANTNYKNMTLYLHDDSPQIKGAPVVAKVGAPLTAALITGLTYAPAAQAGTLYDFLKFMAGAGALVAGGVTVLAFLATAMYAGERGENFLRLFRDNGIVMPRRQFERQLLKSLDMLKDFPSAEMSDAGGKIIDQINLGYHTMAARTAFQRASENHGLTAPFSRWKMRGEIKRLVKFAGQMGMEEGEINHLLGVLRASPESNLFNTQLEAAIQNQLNNFESLVKQAQGHVKTYLPKPGAA